MLVLQAAVVDSVKREMLKVCIKFYSVDCRMEENCFSFDLNSTQVLDRLAAF